MENRTRTFVTFKGNEYEVNYLQEPRWGKRGEVTICYINLDDYLKDLYHMKQVIAKSERSPRDYYISEQGYKVAFGRLVKKLKKLELIL